MTIITLNDEALPEEMNCVILKKPYTLKYGRIPIRPLNSYSNHEDLILIKVEACGVCGSDYRYYKGENPWSQHSLGHHIDNKPNIVLGHEFSGTVVAVASETNKKWLGKRVIPICFKTCGVCDYCVANRDNICPNTIHLGHGQGWGDLDYYPGGYSEYAPSWGAGCFEIPDNVTFEEASMMDILAVSNHVFKQGDYKKGFPILLIGSGPAGNGIGQVARIKGAEDIIVIERSKQAIEVAKLNGFTTVINSEDRSLKELKKDVLNLTEDHGCISIFDSVGSEESLDLGLSVLDKGGTFVNMAVHDADVKFNNMRLSGERKITTSSNFRLKDYKEVLTWLGEKKIDVNPWFTRITLPEIPDFYKKVVDEKNNEYFKLLISEF
jgi:threonine dehydrogenase-like Zn-dependent dehydrogenase